MDPNPYDAPQVEPPTEPLQADLAHSAPVWSRVLALMVPFVAGVAVMTGIDNLAVGWWIAAGVFFAIAGAMLAVAGVGLDAITDSARYIFVMCGRYTLRTKPKSAPQSARASGEAGAKPRGTCTRPIPG